MTDIVKYTGQDIEPFIIQPELPLGLPTKFYTFDQNNSGGSFDYEPQKGIGHYVIVEAYSPEDANQRAERIGLYFDGEGDCSCCGNRWHEQYSWNGSDPGDDEPKVYGETMREASFDFKSQEFSQRLGAGDWRIFVHRLNGRIEAYR